MAHGVEQAQPPVFPLPGGGGIVKDELPPGQQPHLLAGEGSQIPLQPPSLGFVGAEQDDAAPGHLVQGGRDVGPVDAGQPRDGCRAASRLHLGQQFGKFRLFDDDFR